MQSLENNTVEIIFRKLLLNVEVACIYVEVFHINVVMILNKTRYPLVSNENTPSILIPQNTPLQMLVTRLMLF